MPAAGSSRYPVYYPDEEDTYQSDHRGQYGRDLYNPTSVAQGDAHDAYARWPAYEADFYTVFEQNHTSQSYDDAPAGANSSSKHRGTRAGKRKRQEPTTTAPVPAFITEPSQRKNKKRKNKHPNNNTKFSAPHTQQHSSVNNFHPPPQPYVSNAILIPREAVYSPVTHSSLPPPHPSLPLPPRQLPPTPVTQFPPVPGDTVYESRIRPMNPAAQHPSPFSFPPSSASSASPEVAQVRAPGSSKPRNTQTKSLPKRPAPATPSVPLKPNPPKARPAAKSTQIGVPDEDTSCGDGKFRTKAEDHFIQVKRDRSLVLLHVPRKLRTEQWVHEWATQATGILCTGLVQVSRDKVLVQLGAPSIAKMAFKSPRLKGNDGRPGIRVRWYKGHIADPPDPPPVPVIAEAPVALDQPVQANADPEPAAGAADEEEGEAVIEAEGDTEDIEEGEVRDLLVNDTEWHADDAPDLVNDAVLVAHERPTLLDRMSSPYPSEDKMQLHHDSQSLPSDRFQTRSPHSDVHIPSEELIGSLPLTSSRSGFSHRQSTHIVKATASYKGKEKAWDDNGPMPTEGSIAPRPHSGAIIYDIEADISNSRALEQSDDGRRLDPTEATRTEGGSRILPSPMTVAIPPIPPRHIEESPKLEYPPFSPDSMAKLTLPATCPTSPTPLQVPSTVEEPSLVDTSSTDAPKLAFEQEKERLRAAAKASIILPHPRTCGNQQRPASPPPTNALLLEHDVSPDLSSASSSTTPNLTTPIDDSLVVSFINDAIRVAQSSPSLLPTSIQRGPSPPMNVGPLALEERAARLSQQIAESNRLMTLYSSEADKGRRSAIWQQIKLHNQVMEREKAKVQTSMQRAREGLKLAVVANNSTKTIAKRWPDFTVSRMIIDLDDDDD